MSTYLTSYLIFDGEARAAMEFYRATFGGQLDVMTYGDMGGGGDAGDSGGGGAADGVMHARLVTTDGFRVFASDGPPGEAVRRGTDFAIALSADAGEEAAVQAWWDAFAVDGTVDVPFEKQMWGDWFGQITDPWGVAWMFNLDTGQQPPAA